MSQFFASIWQSAVNGGLSAAQILGFGLTIVASYFSARWGGAESRRQFKAKVESDRRAAALALIPPLLQFADECDHRKGLLSQYISSDAQEGEDTSLAGIDLDAEVRKNAAALGPIVATRAIKLDLTKRRCVADLQDSAPYDDRADLDERLLSYFALLSLRARYLVDLAAVEAGLSISHPQSEMDQLLKEAIKFGYEVDEGDEKSWR